MLVFTSAVGQGLAMSQWVRVRVLRAVRVADGPVALVDEDPDEGAVGDAVPVSRLSVELRVGEIPLAVAEIVVE